MTPKFENNWRSKNLENLEKDFWGEPTFDSYLVTTCHRLRKKPLKEFEIEDLRIMVGQNIGLKYLIPLAIEVLENDILAEGDFYEGDLLKSVLSSDKNYWKLEKENWLKVNEIFKKNRMRLEKDDTTEEIKKGWFESFLQFAKIN